MRTHSEAKLRLVVTALTVLHTGEKLRLFIPKCIRAMLICEDFNFGTKETFYVYGSRQFKAAKMNERGLFPCSQSRRAKLPALVLDGFLITESDT